jgi:hypothetical protein
MVAAQPREAWRRRGNALTFVVVYLLIRGHGLKDI